MALLAIGAFALPTPINVAADQASGHGQLQARGESSSTVADGTEATSPIAKSTGATWGWRSTDPNYVRPAVKCYRCQQTFRKWPEFDRHHKYNHPGEAQHVGYWPEAHDPEHKATWGWKSTDPNYVRPAVTCHRCQQPFKHLTEFERHHKNNHPGEGKHVTYWPEALDPESEVTSQATVPPPGVAA